MKKTLLTYDEGLAIRDINIINKTVIPEIYENLLPVFNKLGIGHMTKDLFIDLVESEGNKTIEAVVKETNKQLDGAKIKLPSLRQSMMSESLSIIEEVKLLASKINARFGKHVRNLDNSENNYLKHLSFDDTGIPFLSDAGRISVEESYKIYITSEAGHSLRELHINAVKATNEFLSQIQRIRKLPGIVPLAHIFKVVDGNTVSIDATELNYDALAAL